MAVLGHDLRSPIQALNARAFVLLKGTLDDAQRAQVRGIERHCARMTALVADILDFAHLRLGNGEIPARRRQCALRAICETAIDEVRATSSGRSIRFGVTTEGHGLWDPSRMQQLLVNIVANAVLHSPPSTLVATALDATADRLEFSVHNWGPPIDARDLSTIFEPFRRVERDDDQAHGLGLGLFIARGIAQAHGGDIRVSSSAESGTTFRIVLDPGLVVSTG
jgi:signal transduction histidine kinase